MAIMNGGIMDTGATGGMMGGGATGGMMGYGYSSWYGLLGLLYFVIAAFIFAVIFWLTYNLLVNEKKKRRK